MTPRARRAATILLAVAIPVTLPLLGEAIVRRLYSDPPPAFVMHPLLGAVRAPGYSVEKINVDTGQPFRFEVNELGLRGKNLRTREKAKGTYRIFFVGGSSTESPNTPEEETFPGLVEARLNERLQRSPRVEVGNAGVSGATSHYSLAQIAHRLLQLEPDLIVVLDGINDLSDSLREGWDPTTYEYAKTRPVHLKEWLVDWSRMVALLDARIGATRERDAREYFAARARARRAKPVSEPPYSVTRGLDRFTTNLRRMALLCKDAGVALALATPPRLVKPVVTKEEDERITLTLVNGTPWNLKVETLAAALDAYDEGIRSVARDRGALLVDASTLVPRKLSSFVDDAHLSREGNAAVADAVLATILANGSLPRGR